MVTVDNETGAVPAPHGGLVAAKEAAVEIFRNGASERVETFVARHDTHA